jgi:hypothetical protein
MCDCEQVGDEKHYLFICKHDKVMELRNSFYAHNLEHLSQDEIFVKIISCPDSFICSNFSKLVFNILDLFIVNVPNKISYPIKEQLGLLTWQVFICAAQQNNVTTW